MDALHGHRNNPLRANPSGERHENVLVLGRPWMETIMESEQSVYVSSLTDLQSWACSMLVYLARNARYTRTWCEADCVSMNMISVECMSQDLGLPTPT